MSRYDEYDDRYDNEICEADVRDTCKGLEALTRGYNGRREYVRSVDRVFYDIFGINYVGSIFATKSRNRRDDEVKIDIFNRCGSKRLIDMILDDQTYFTLQNLVKLHHDMSIVGSKSKDREEAANIYTDTIDRIKKEYAIRTRSHIGNLSNPLKNLRKLSRNYDDRYGYRDYDDDDDDYYYRDYDREYDDTDFVSSILKDVDPDIIKRRSGKTFKKKKNTRSSRDDYDDDFEAIMADTFSKIASSLEKLNDRIDNLEKNDSYDDRYDGRNMFDDYVPSASTRERRSVPTSYNTDDSGLRSTINALARSVKSIAASQAEAREDLDNVIGVIQEAIREDEDDNPPNSGGDLLKTTGGVNNST